MRKHAEQAAAAIGDQDIDPKTKSVLVNYFQFASDRYYRMRNAVIVFAIIISLGCAGGIWQGQQSASKLSAEGVDRRNQTCTIFERQQKRSVQGVVTSYAYINSLSLKEAHSALNQVIIRQLPETYAKAKEDAAPQYCNEKGVGLPEPDPVLPHEHDYKYLLLKSK